MREILAALRQLGDGKDEVSIGDVVEAFGNRSYGPVLLVLALIGISPIGGVPGIPAFLATVIALFAVQMVIGRASSDCQASSAAARSQVTSWLNPPTSSRDRAR